MLYKDNIRRFVLIEKCKNSLLWYREFVGKEWEIHGEEDDIFWAKEPEGYRNIIYKEDCQLYRTE